MVSRTRSLLIPNESIGEKGRKSKVLVAGLQVRKIFRAGTLSRLQKASAFLDSPSCGSPKASIIPIEELTRWPWRCCADMHHYRRFHSRPGRAHTSGARSDDDKHTSHQQKKVGPTKGDRILCISAILHATTTTTWRRDIGACLHAYSSFSCCNVSPLPHAFHSLCWLLRAALACH
jgi:hypothetical protein